MEMTEENPKPETITHSRRTLLKSAGAATTVLAFGPKSVSALSEDHVPVPAGVEVPKSNITVEPTAEPPVDMDIKKRRAHNRSPVVDSNGKATRNKEQESDEVDPMPGSNSNRYLSYARDEYITGKYHVMEATFNVPSEPAAGNSADDTIMYYFPALINCDSICTTTQSIIQPVLQWNQEDTDFAYDWSIASWYGSGSNADNYHRSPALAANAGDTIYGSMEYHSDRNQWYIYTENVTDGRYTAIWAPESFSDYAWDRAYCTLESFYWEQNCDELPGSSTFRNVYLENASGNRVKPDWGENTDNVSCPLSCFVSNYDKIYLRTPY